jgi:N-acyl-D-aspartate/D-glutamate deacylase
VGNCGVGFAPVLPNDKQRLVELMEGVEDIPATALYEGIRWEWESFPEYLDALDRMPRAVDVGAQIPHAAVRAYVMGERALEDATASDLATICSIVTSAMEAGALGFSTGRTSGHRDVRGRPVPGTYAAEEELEVIFRALAQVGHGVFQVVPAGIGGIEGGDPEGSMERELAWILRLASLASVPLTFLVMQSSFDPDGWRPWFEAVREANAGGARLRPQIGSRCFSALIGHQSRLNPFRYTDAYQRLADLPLVERIAHLRDPGTRATILAQAPAANARSMTLDRITPGKFERLFHLGQNLDYEPPLDASVAALAARRGEDPWHVMYDLMLGADGTEFLLFPLLNFARGSYDGLYDMMCDQELTDARPGHLIRGL